MFLKCICLCAVVFSTSLFAEKTKTRKWQIEIGAYHTNLRDRWAVPNRYRPYVSSLTGFTRLRRELSLSKVLSLDPSLALQIPWVSSADGSQKQLLTHLDLDFRVAPLSFLLWRVGAGVLTSWSFGSERSVELNNGNSTATFYSPGGLTLGWILTAQLGLEIRIGARLTFGGSVWVLKLFQKNRRQYHGAATIGYRF